MDGLSVLDTRLIDYLMRADGVSATSNEARATYKAKADKITSAIAGEEYLSLDLALEDGDISTIEALIEKALTSTEN